MVSERGVRMGSEGDLGSFGRAALIEVRRLLLLLLLLLSMR
jgi:hypothetical protein